MNKCNNNTTNKYICFEEFVLSKIDESIKKLKIEMFDFEINILSDNHQYKFISAHLSNFTFKLENLFNYYYDKSKVKLLKQTQEIRIQDLMLTATNHNKSILLLDNFVFSINEDNIYNKELKTGNILSNMVLELPKLNITLSITELEKIVDILSVIFSGVERLEGKNKDFNNKNNTNNYNYEYSSRYYSNYDNIKNSHHKGKSKNSHKSAIGIPDQGLIGLVIYEEYNSENLIKLKLENSNIILNDKDVLVEFNNFAMSFILEEKKFAFSKIEIYIKPINITMFNVHKSIYNVNLQSRSVKLLIAKDFSLKNNKLEVFIEEGFLALHDEMLLQIIKFLGKILSLISLLESQNNNNNKINNNFKQNNNFSTNADVGDKKASEANNPTSAAKKDIQEISFKNFFVFYYIDIQDLFIFKIKSVSIKLQESLEFQGFKAYYRNVSLFAVNNIIKLVKLKRLNIKMYPSSQLIDAANQSSSNKIKKQDSERIIKKNIYAINMTEIDFHEIKINVYVKELLAPALKLVNFFQFFSLWVTYHFSIRPGIEAQSSQNLNFDLKPNTSKAKEMLENNPLISQMNKIKQKNIIRISFDLINVKIFEKFNQRIRIPHTTTEDRTTGTISDYSVILYKTALILVNYEEDFFILENKSKNFIFYFFN